MDNPFLLLALVFLVYVVWTLRKVFGETGTNTDHATSSLPARQHADAEVPILRWSGEKTAALPLRQLTRQQTDCLGCLAYHARITRDGKDAPLLDGEPAYDFTGRTLDSLENHGFVTRVGSAYQITDLGLRALETLPTRY